MIIFAYVRLNVYWARLLGLFCGRNYQYRPRFHTETRRAKFISNHPDSFPPVVINITDGEPNDSSAATTEAKKLAQLKTSDGNVIVLNAHISNASAGKIELPSDNAGFSNNKFANFLFDISSVLPDPLAESAKNAGFNVQPNARGFIFNADAEALIKLLQFGSKGALR